MSGNSRFRKKRNKTHIVADRVDESDVPIGPEYGVGGQLRWANLMIWTFFIEQKREGGIEAEGSVRGPICRGENDIFVFIDAFPESRAADLHFIAADIGQARIRKNKIHASGSDLAMIKESSQSEGEVFAIPWEIAEFRDRVGIHIHVADFHGSLDWSAEIESGIDRFLLQKGGGSIRSEEIILFFEVVKRDLRENDPESADQKNECN